MKFKTSASGCALGIGLEFQRKRSPYSLNLYLTKLHLDSDTLSFTTFFCCKFLDPYTSHDPKDWIVKVGEHRLRDKEVFEQSVRITNITTHEWYKSMWFEGITDTPPTYDIGE